MHQKNVALDTRFITHPESADQFIDLDRLFAIARRRVWGVALFTLFGLVLGVAYLVATPPTYTSATRILLDESLTDLADGDERRPPPGEADARILSEVEILKSEQLALSVARELELHENEDFLDPPQAPTSWLKAQVKSLLQSVMPQPERTGSPGEAGLLGRAVAMLQRNLVVERVGRSFVIEVKYSAKDPDVAGDVTRTYADKYLSDQLDANFDATERATLWLQERLSELRDDWLTASLKAERFRAENGLTSARGELVSEQQLADLNNQLILAQAETANARARYEQYRSIVESGKANAVENATIPSDMANSEVLNELKSRYLGMSDREREIAARFGEDHPQAITLRRQLQDLANQIYKELQQVAESYRNEYEVARSREASLRENVGALTGENSDANQALVRLRELEQRASALGTLYENYLARYEEASQQQTFPIAGARVISEAADPVSPSSPSKTLVLAMSLVLGAFAGAGVAALREFRERFLRTGDEVRDRLGLDFLGYLPLIGTPSPRRHPRRDEEGAAALDAAGQSLLRIAVNAPTSHFAETLRSARLAADVLLHGRTSRVIGCISVLPREGKTTVAANFASLLAASGARTLLIDADLRNPGLSRRLAVAPESGLVEALVGHAAWQDTVIVDRKTRLSIVPAVVRGRLPHTSELVSGQHMQALIEEARSHYDYVVVDLPPLGPVIDARAFAPIADGFLMVAAWGATPRALIRSTLVSEPQVAAKLLGLVLNKTDMKKLPRYGTPGGAEHYIGHYAAYYAENGGRAA